MCLLRVCFVCCVLVTFANSALRTGAAAICEDKYHSHSHHLAYGKCRELDGEGKEEGEKEEPRKRIEKKNEMSIL